MKSKIAIFPGSFDPLTKGHVAVIRKALPLFEKIVIAIGQNSSKNNYFSLEERMKHIEFVFKNDANIEVASYSGLTIDFCKEVNAEFIVRGLRDGKDFEYEKSIAIMNNELQPNIETMFFMTDAEFSAINSVIIRDILRHGGDASKFLPNALNEYLSK